MRQKIKSIIKKSYIIDKIDIKVISQDKNSQKFEFGIKR